MLFTSLVDNIRPRRSLSIADKDEPVTSSGGDVASMEYDTPSPSVVTASDPGFATPLNGFLPSPPPATAAQMLHAFQPIGKVSMVPPTLKMMATRFIETVEPISPLPSLPTASATLTASVMASHVPFETVLQPQFARRQQHPAVAQVLTSPELLSMILGYLENSMATTTDPTQPIDFVRVDSIKYTLTTPKLVQALYVNRLWNACATPIMYKNTRLGTGKGCELFAQTLTQASMLSHRYGHYVRSVVFVTPSSPQQAVSEGEAGRLSTVLRAIASTCYRLNDLNLSGCTEVMDEDIVAIANGCARLRRLNLNRCDLLTSTAVDALASARLPLISLNLSRPVMTPRRMIDDAALANLITVSPRLIELRLRNCNTLTEATASKIGQTCTQLMALDLSWCNKVTDRSLISLGENCKHLRSIALNGCKKLTDTSLKVLLANTPSLASLSLSHLLMMTDDVITTVAPMLRNLTILSLNGCSNISDASIIAMAKACPKMQSLSLFAIDIGDESIRAIAQSCPLISAFSVSGCDRVTDAGAIAITRLGLLQSLYLNAHQITDFCVEAIVTHCRALKALSLNDCLRLTNTSLLAIAGHLNKLQSLSINKTGVSNSGICKVIEHCKELRELSAKECVSVHDGPWVQVIKSKRRMAIIVDRAVPPTT